jgi:hypothetical protein
MEGAIHALILSVSWGRFKYSVNTNNFDIISTITIRDSFWVMPTNRNNGRHPTDYNNEYDH